MLSSQSGEVAVRNGKKEEGVEECLLSVLPSSFSESTADKVEKRLEVTTLIGEATAFDEHIENDQEALEEPSNSLNIKAVDSENELGSTDNKHSSTM